MALRDDLKFESNRALFLFAMEIMQNIKEWQSNGFEFYIRHRERKEIAEVQIHIYPETE